MPDGRPEPLTSASASSTSPAASDPSRRVRRGDVTGQERSRRRASVPVERSHRAWETAGRERASRHVGSLPTLDRRGRTDAAVPDLDPGQRRRGLPQRRHAAVRHDLRRRAGPRPPTQLRADGTVHRGRGAPARHRRVGHLRRLPVPEHVGVPADGGAHARHDARDGGRTGPGGQRRSALSPAAGRSEHRRVGSPVTVGDAHHASTGHRHHRRDVCSRRGVGGVVARGRHRDRLGAARPRADVLRAHRRVLRSARERHGDRRHRTWRSRATAAARHRRRSDTARQPPDRRARHDRVGPPGDSALAARTDGRRGSGMDGALRRRTRRGRRAHRRDTTGRPGRRRHGRVRVVPPRPRPPRSRRVRTRRTVVGAGTSDRAGARRPTPVRPTGT